MKPGFPMADDSGTHEDMIEDFKDAVAAFMDIA